jgi:hypothetical protein
VSEETYYDSGLLVGFIESRVITRMGREDIRRGPRDSGVMTFPLVLLFM